jgi:hypothetical protein
MCTSGTLYMKIIRYMYVYLLIPIPNLRDNHPIAYSDKAKTGCMYSRYHPVHKINNYTFQISKYRVFALPSAACCWVLLLGSAGFTVLLKRYRPLDLWEFSNLLSTVQWNIVENLWAIHYLLLIKLIANIFISKLTSQGHYIYTCTCMRPKNHTNIALLHYCT